MNQLKTIKMIIGRTKKRLSEMEPWSSPTAFGCHLSGKNPTVVAAKNAARQFVAREGFEAAVAELPDWCGSCSAFESQGAWETSLRLLEEYVNDMEWKKLL